MFSFLHSLEETFLLSMNTPLPDHSQYFATSKNNNISSTIQYDQPPTTISDNVATMTKSMAPRAVAINGQRAKQPTLRRPVLPPSDTSDSDGIETPGASSDEEEMPAQSVPANVGPQQDDDIHSTTSDEISDADLISMDSRGDDEGSMAQDDGFDSDDDVDLDSSSDSLTSSNIRMNHLDREPIYRPARSVPRYHDIRNVNPAPGTLYDRIRREEVKRDLRSCGPRFPSIATGAVGRNHFPQNNHISFHGADDDGSSSSDMSSYESDSSSLGGYVDERGPGHVHDEETNWDESSVGDTDLSHDHSADEQGTQGYDQYSTEDEDSLGETDLFGGRPADEQGIQDYDQHSSQDGSSLEETDFTSEHHDNESPDHNHTSLSEDSDDSTEVPAKYQGGHDYSDSSSESSSSEDRDSSGDDLGAPGGRNNHDSMSERSSEYAGYTLSPASFNYRRFYPTYDSESMSSSESSESSESSSSGADSVEPSADGDLSDNSASSSRSSSLGSGTNYGTSYADQRSQEDRDASDSDSESESDSSSSSDEDQSERDIEAQSAREVRAAAHDKFSDTSSESAGTLKNEPAASVPSTGRIPVWSQAEAVANKKLPLTDFKQTLEFRKVWKAEPVKLWNPQDPAAKEEFLSTFKVSKLPLRPAPNAVPSANMKVKISSNKTFSSGQHLSLVLEADKFLDNLAIRMSNDEFQEADVEISHLTKDPVPHTTNSEIATPGRKKRSLATVDQFEVDIMMGMMKKYDDTVSTAKVQGEHLTFDDDGVPQKKRKIAEDDVSEAPKGQFRQRVVVMSKKRVPYNKGYRASYRAEQFLQQSEVLDGIKARAKRVQANGKTIKPSNEPTSADQQSQLEVMGGGEFHESTVGVSRPMSVKGFYASRPDPVTDPDGNTAFWDKQLERHKNSGPRYLRKLNRRKDRDVQKQTSMNTTATKDPQSDEDSTMAGVEDSSSGSSSDELKSTSSVLQDDPAWNQLLKDANKSGLRNTLLKLLNMDPATAKSRIFNDNDTRATADISRAELENEIFETFRMITNRDSLGFYHDRPNPVKNPDENVAYWDNLIAEDKDSSPVYLGYLSKLKKKDAKKKVLWDNLEDGDREKLDASGGVPKCKNSPSFFKPRATSMESPAEEEWNEQEVDTAKNNELWAPWEGIKD